MVSSNSLIAIPEFIVNAFNSLTLFPQGYPGGVFDPLGFAKGNAKEVQTKEIKNGRLAMIAFAG